MLVFSSTLMHALFLFIYSKSWQVAYQPVDNKFDSNHHQDPKNQKSSNND